MGFRDRLRRLAREAEYEMITIEQEDGTVKRFHRDAFMDCFLHETQRGRRYYFGEDPGQAHPMVEALRKVSDSELARLMGDHGTMLGHFVGEDEIIRGERERPGPPVRETSPGVYE
jgi:hypothetical protein